MRQNKQPEGGQKNVIGIVKQKEDYFLEEGTDDTVKCFCGIRKDNNNCKVVIGFNINFMLLVTLKREQFGQPREGAQH